jgi:hypothetical protein
VETSTKGQQSGLKNYDGCIQTLRWIM